MWLLYKYPVAHMKCSVQQKDWANNKQATSQLATSPMIMRSWVQCQTSELHVCMQPLGVALMASGLATGATFYGNSVKEPHFSMAALSSSTLNASATSRPLSFSISLKTSTELTFLPSAKYARKRHSCRLCCFPLLWANSSRRWAFFVGIANRLMVKVSPCRRGRGTTLATLSRIKCNSKRASL